MSTRIYHNPRCNKCRVTMQLLEEQGEEPEVVEYLKAPPTRQELVEILDMLKREPRDIMRTHEPEYKESGADNTDLSRDGLIDKILEYPKLLQRPIVIKDGKAIIGRPPENVLEIL